MTAAPILSVFGGDLTEADYATLAARWITPELADAAGIRRVDSVTGCGMFGRKRGDLAGLIIPNLWPGEGHVREYRLRLDHPELERSIDGSVRERGKYIGPPQRGNVLYIPPGTPPALLADTQIPVVVTEGEFKALALLRASCTGARFLSVSVAGVWCFRGTVGKTTGPDGDRRDVKGVLPDFGRIAWKGRRVVIAYDADGEQNPKVRAARAALTATLVERGATVGVLEWPVSEGKGVDDWLAHVGLEQFLSALQGVEFGAWSTRLLRTEDGRIIACTDNVALYLEHVPEWAGVLGYNEFTAGIEILKTPPAPVTAAVSSEIEDTFDTEAVRWLERRRLMVKPELVRRIVDAVARRNPYHPVRDYFDACSWDGKPRIDDWLPDYCGAASSDYLNQIGARFLISAVARIYQPGCKADHLLILEGVQGSGKSSAVRVLAGEWFSDQLADMGSKDASMQLRGVLIVELSELDALNRSEMARAKAFLSMQTERFRLPYGRRVVQVPRQCVFIGTTNSDQWLKDETGGRRFWPVRCGQIDIPGLERDRDQLWAEAVHRYRAGERWWLEDAAVIQEATEEQRGRYAEDVWQVKVEEYAAAEADSPASAPRCSVAIPEILARLGIEIARQDQIAANRVARCLKAAGWERYRQRTDDGRVWRYRRVEA